MERYKNTWLPITGRLHAALIIKEALVATTGCWASKTPEQAHAFLAKPDVTVTNESDKQRQLKKIEVLNDKVRHAFEEITRREEAKKAQLRAAQKAAVDEAQAGVDAARAALAQAKAALSEWEHKNDAIAGDKNQYKIAVRNAELQVTGAEEKLSSVVPSPVKKVPSEKVDAFLSKVKMTMNQVKSATVLNWTSKSISDADCEVIAHLIASAMPFGSTARWMLCDVSLIRTPCCRTSATW